MSAARERVVGLDEVAHWEVMGDETGGIKLVTRRESQQGGRRRRVDEPRRDRDVTGPQRFEVQRGRSAVHADVGDMATRADQRCCELECCRDTDRFDRDVGTETTGELLNDLERILVAVVDDHVGPEHLRRFETALGQVDRDDVARAEQPSAHDGGEADGARAHDGDDVARLHMAVEHADLVAGGEDVGEHQDLFVGHAGGDRIRGVVGERHPHELGLRAVDEVAEDPATAADALPVAGFAAEAARAARRDARHEHAIARLHVLHRSADGFDRADGLVAEDAPEGYFGHVPLQDVQV